MNSSVLRDAVMNSSVAEDSLAVHVLSAVRYFMPLMHVGW